MSKNDLVHDNMCILIKCTNVENKCSFDRQNSSRIRMVYFIYGSFNSRSKITSKLFKRFYWFYSHDSESVYICHILKQWSQVFLKSNLERHFRFNELIKYLLTTKNFLWFISHVAAVSKQGRIRREIKSTFKMGYSAKPSLVACQIRVWKLFS